MKTVDLCDVKKIVQRHRNKKGGLIPLLQEIQSEYGFVPEESVELISKELGIFPVEIYGILTFYAQFYLVPRGKYTIKVCQGTACYIMGGKAILDHMSNKLEVEVDGTTKDGLFSLERVACLGCCGMGPVVVVGEDFHGRCTIQEGEKLLEEYRVKGTE